MILGAPAQGHCMASYMCKRHTGCRVDGDSLLHTEVARGAYRSSRMSSEDESGR